MEKTFAKIIFAENVFRGIVEKNIKNCQKLVITHTNVVRYLITTLINLLFFFLLT